MVPLCHGSAEIVPASRHYFGLDVPTLESVMTSLKWREVQGYD
jgi:hypothetical protein